MKYGTFSKGAAVGVLLLFIGVLVVQAAPGDRDPNFGLNGNVAVPGMTYGYAEAVALTPKGKILVGGSQDSDFLIARLKKNGRQDKTFAKKAYITTDFGAIDTVSDLAVNPRGKFVAVGTSSASPNSSAIAVARYKPNGKLDPRFDGDGMKLIALNGTPNAASGHGVVLTPDNKIVIVGQGSTEQGFAIILIRLNPDGSFDTSFDEDGIVITPLQSPLHKSAVTLTPAGQIVVAGTTYAEATGNDFAAARYNSDGGLDVDFGSAGITSVDLGGDDHASAVAVTADGKIVIAGAHYIETDYDTLGDFAAVCLTDKGLVDTSFGDNGRLITDFLPEAASSEYASTILIDAQGRLLMVGSVFDEVAAGAGGFALARYTSAGVADASFGVQGQVTLKLGSRNGAGLDALLDPIGRIVVAGGGTISSEARPAVARFLP